MRGLVLDAGAFIAVERNDRAVSTRIRRAEADGVELRTSAIVIAQVWRDERGRQARLARLLRRVNVRPVDEEMGRDAGALLGRAGTSDPIDATVVLLAEAGDVILTSDPADIARLADVAGRRAIVLGC